MSERSGEPTLEDVRREFPGWAVWKGISGLYYGRRVGVNSGEHDVQGEGPRDLRDQIIRAEAPQER